MSFISNAEHLTFKDGTYTNIQVQNVYYGKHASRVAVTDEQKPGQSLHHSREEEEEDVQVIRKEHLKVTLEIGSGRGYLLHAGESQGRAVISKVYHANAEARKLMESTVSFTKALMHPNILRIQGKSSPTSSIQFITYENAFWKTAEGPLAAALREDLTKSVALGFKMIASLASGLNYLKIQGMSSLGVENFHVLLDLNDRFLICVDPPHDDLTPESGQEPSSDDIWEVFNALCQKVLTSANTALYKEGIKRTPVQQPNLPPLVKGALHRTFGPPQLAPEASPHDGSVPPRREYVWRAMRRGAQSLDDIASDIHRDLDLKLLIVPTLARSDHYAAHRCDGYSREEITLTTTVAASTVVMNATPSPREVCIICHEVVGAHEVIRCICGSDDVSKFSPTVKCQECGSWSHRHCVDD